MRKLIEWPDYDQAEAFQFNKVINEPSISSVYGRRLPIGEGVQRAL